MYSLIKFTKDKGLTHLKELLEAESNFILDSINSISDFEKINSKKELIDNAIADLENNAIKKDEIRIKRSIVEVLSLFYMYLETVEVVIKKDFGKKSIQMNDYELIKSHMFDNYFAYRFLYRLRHYIIHCVFPPFTLNVSKDSPKEVIIYKRNLDRTNSAWQGQLAKDLNGSIEEFELIGMFKELFQCIAKISNECVNHYDITKLRVGCENIMSYKHLIEKGESLSICTLVWSNTGKLTSLNAVMEFPFAKCEQILGRINIGTNINNC